MKKNFADYALYGILLFLGLFHLVGALTPPETLFKWFLTDDAFFYFVVARNIVAGNGITFDGFGLSSGFHPLWMLINLPVFTVSGNDLMLPLRLLVVVMGAMHMGAVALVFRLLKSLLSSQTAIIGAALWAFSPFVHQVAARNGLESPVSALLLVALLFLTTQAARKEHLPARDLATLGVVGGLAFLARLDNIFVVLMMGAWLVFRKSPLRVLLLVDVIGVYLTTSAAYILRLGITPTFYEYSKGIFVFFAVTYLARVLTLYLMDMYTTVDTKSPTWLNRMALAFGVSLAISSGIMLALSALNVVHGLPRMALLYEAALGFGFMLFSRVFLQWLRGSALAAKQTPIETIKTYGAQWIKDGALYFGIVALFLIAYVGWSHFTFGTSTPMSGQIKEWWGTLPDNMYGDPAQTVGQFYGTDPFYGKGPWFFVLGPLFAPLENAPQAASWLLWAVLVGLGLWTLKAQQTQFARNVIALALLPLFTGSLLHYWTYTTRAYVGLRGWYWISEILFVILLAALILHHLTQWAQQRLAAPRVWQAVPLIFSAGMAVYFGTLLAQLLVFNVTASEKDWHLLNTRALEAHTKPGDVIGMTGGGDVAYLVQDRTIVNLDGLINSVEYAELLQQYRAAEYASRVGMDYVYANPYAITSTDPYARNFGSYITLLVKLYDFDLFTFTYP